MDNSFFFFLAGPLGWVFRNIYNLLPENWPRYAIAIVVFTLIVKLCLLPLTLKQQKSMLKQQKLQPQLNELQKKYAHDKEKLSRETMELYKANGASPTAGCLPLLIQLPIIMALYRVIQRPLTYVTQIAEFSTSTTKEAAIGKVHELIDVATQHGISLSSFGDAFKDDNSIWTTLLNNQISISDLAHKVSGTVADCAQWIREAAINFNFFGMNLAYKPSIAGSALLNVCFSDGSQLAQLVEYWPLLLIPILSGLSSWYISYMTQSKQKKQTVPNAAEPDQAQAMSKSMTYMMPLISVFITFTLPSAIGVYWTISNIFQIIQQFITQKMFNKKEADFVVVDTIKKNRKDSKKRR